MHVVYVLYTWASLQRSDCVLVIVVLGWKPLEDVRKSRLRSVTKHHCSSAKGFCWEKNPATKKKNAFTALPCLLLLPPPRTKIWYLQTLLQFTIKKFPCPWRTQQTSLFSCTEEGWKQWARVPSWLLTSSENDKLHLKSLWVDEHFIPVWEIVTFTFTVPLSWLFCLSCSRAPWPCRNRCWEERDFWSLDTY